MSIYNDFAEYYDFDFGSFAADIPLYREMAKRTGSPILELMCGTGRILVPLAEDGYTITGVDASTPMLEVARHKVAEAGVAHRVTLIHDDVRTADLPAQHFALAFVAINSFMHLERVKDQLAALAAIRRALAPDGLLIIDLFSPDPTQLSREDNRLILERYYQVDGLRMFKFVASESDMATQTSTMTYLFDELAPDGQVMRRVLRFTMRWFYRYELEHLLARAGFAVRSLYGSYDLDDYTSASERLIAVAALSKGFGAR
ncbi:MAG: class I SAM-dependent methyltransferase [Chloroflexaceae bacterium]|nr:class I SAM-dependent methyltransferase [Chloroflexaceae bacterium]